MKLLKTNEFGRSMIEMLGVLAIVGILSVSGISGFSKAMKKHKYIKLANEYNQLIQDLLLYKDGFIRAKKEKGDGTATLDIAAYIAAAGLMPEGWTQKGTVLIDSVNNNVRTFIRDHNNHLVFDYRLKTKDDEKGKEELCRLMILDVLKPYSNDLSSVWIFRGENNSGGALYGDKYCTTGRLCIKDALVTDVLELCSTCLTDAGCLLAIEFD